MKILRAATFVMFILLTAHAADAAPWQIIASPNSGSQNNVLNAVSAAADNDVWAVGSISISDSSTSQTLIEHWNGTAWSVVKSPNGGATFNVLTGVAALSANNAWAVGYFANGTVYRTLIEHWNGTAWSVVSSPNGNSTSSFNFLQGIAAISANDIWAVGNYKADETNTLTLHWNGTAWKVVQSPNVTPETNNSLSGVSAIATNDVWAVGTQQPSSLTATHTLTLHWNGTAWSIVPSANTSQTSSNHLLAAAAVSSNDVWATGFTPSVALAEHWNGSSWGVVSTPTITGGSSPFLSGATALASNNVWAVGQFFQNSISASRTLTEQWNGSSWTIVSSPNNGMFHNFLNGVDATPGGTLWAVGGRYDSNSIQRTLILRKLP